MTDVEMLMQEKDFSKQMKKLVFTSANRVEKVSEAKAKVEQMLLETITSQGSPWASNPLVLVKVLSYYNNAQNIDTRTIFDFLAMLNTKQLAITLSSNSHEKLDITVGGQPVNKETETKILETIAQEPD